MHPGRRLEYKLNRRPGNSTRETQSKAKDKMATIRLTNVKGIFKYFCQICGHSFMKRDNYTVSILLEYIVKNFLFVFNFANI